MVCILRDEKSCWCLIRHSQWSCLTSITWSKWEIGMTKIATTRVAIVRTLKNQNPLWIAARIPRLEVTPKVMRHMNKKKMPTEKETYHNLCIYTYTWGKILFLPYKSPCNRWASCNFHQLWGRCWKQNRLKLCRKLSGQNFFLHIRTKDL